MDSRDGREERATSRVKEREKECLRKRERHQPDRGKERKREGEREKKRGEEERETARERERHEDLSETKMYNEIRQRQPHNNNIKINTFRPYIRYQEL